jgi:hypothetical protein
MMADNVSLLAVFPDLEPAANAIDKLRRLGLPDDQMNVISGVPVTEAMLGRPRQPTNVPRLALGGALGGFVVSVLLVFTPLLYFVPVGGQPTIPVPPSIVVIFELTMLGLLISTFLGVFLDSTFPSYRPMEYVPEISDGKIAVLFNCPQGKMEKFTKAMTAQGAETVEVAEAQQL